MQIIFEFCTEGCVFNVVDLPLESFLFAVERHTTFFCTQMRMIVYAEEDIQHAILIGSYAKKAAHDLPPYV